MKPKYKKQTITARVRRELASRYGCEPYKTVPVYCEICGVKNYIEWRMGVTGRGHGQIVFGLTIDHVIPEKLGGSSEAENLQLLCESCNKKKGFKLIGNKNG